MAGRRAFTSVFDRLCPAMTSVESVVVLSLLPASGEREASLGDARQDEENKMRAPDAAQREAVRC